MRVLLGLVKAQSWRPCVQGRLACGVRAPGPRRMGGFRPVSQEHKVSRQMARRGSRGSARHLRLVHLLGLLASTLAVTHIYDETLWTKHLWTKNWKLSNPLASTNPTDENPALLKSYPDVSGVLKNSLDGPTYRKDKSEARCAVQIENPRLVQPTIRLNRISNK